MQSFRTGNIATLTVQASIRCNDISIRTNNDNNTVRIASESVFSHLTRVSFFAAYERDRVCVVAVGKPNGNTCGFRAPEGRDAADRKPGENVAADRKPGENVAVVPRGAKVFGRARTPFAYGRSVRPTRPDRESVDPTESR